MPKCGIADCGKDAGSINAVSSAHERLLDLGERRVLVEPFALGSVLVPECAFDVGVCDGEELLYDKSVLL